jgi:hypothetical protein|tara:strand:- start:14 stop:382 length:369 start_codon:yes stop_codon:yes gene_type:complete
MKLEEKNEITLTKTITNENINNYMVACFEGGSNYWIDKVDVTNGDFKGGKYASDVLGLGGMLEIVTDSSRILIDKNSILRALNHLNNIGYRKVLNRLLDMEYDSGDTDVLLQVACFDDVIYG